jgi:MYXO-CTERM domain-containing protein
MKTIVTAIVAVLMCSASALADLTGTQMNITITHTGPAGGMVGPAVFNHTYGGVNMFTNPFLGSFTVASPAMTPGYDNAVLIDFTTFNYIGFADNLGTAVFASVDEPIDPTSITLLANNVPIGINILQSGDGFTASWNTNDLLAASPTTDNMVVAWNSMPVPAPGALALLGLAAVAPHGRRRNRLT